MVLIVFLFFLLITSLREDLALGEFLAQIMFLCVVFLSAVSLGDSVVLDKMAKDKAKI